MFEDIKRAGAIRKTTKWPAAKSLSGLRSATKYPGKVTCGNKRPLKLAQSFIAARYFSVGIIYTPITYRTKLANMCLLSADSKTGVGNDREGRFKLGLFCPAGKGACNFCFSNPIWETKMWLPNNVSAERKWFHQLVADPILVPTFLSNAQPLFRQTYCAQKMRYQLTLS